MKLLYLWHRVRTVARYAWTLWRTSKMPLMIDTLSPAEEAAIARQAELDGIPVAHWGRNHLLAALPAAAREHLRAQPSVDATLAAMEEGASAADALADMGGGPGVGAGGHVFGLPPELLESESVVPPVPVAAPAPAPPSSINGRRVSTGHHPPAAPTTPPATTQGGLGHPCRFLLPQFPGNMTAMDCQGTCNARERQGSACTWPPNAARNCYAFGAKAGAAPSPFPRP